MPGRIDWIAQPIAYKPAPMKTRCIHFWVSLCSLIPGTANAHAFAQVYAPPIPVWLYLLGASLALVASFLVMSLFLRKDLTSASINTQWVVAGYDTPTVKTCLVLLKAAALVFLLFAIASGLFGTANPYKNFNMTAFWIIFLLFYVYLSALIGNLYVVINPWNTLYSLLLPRQFQGLWQYPKCLAYYPALASYAIIVWLELFGHSQPFSLSILLMVYTLIGFVGCVAWGRTQWFRYGDGLSVLIRLLSMSGIFSRVSSNIVIQAPFSKLQKRQCDTFSQLLFILFILASTAFDGIHRTALWINETSTWIAPLAQLFFGEASASNYIYQRIVVMVIQTSSLVAFPALYLAAFAAAIWLGNRLNGLRLNTKEDILHCSYCLIPIALAYHLSHYFTLLLIQGPAILHLLSDPFGIGWNIFGTSNMGLNRSLPNSAFIWHFQVAVIVLGHIASSWISHRYATRRHSSQRAAIRSQIPMLVLMVIYTSSGLWIMSLPSL